MNTESNVQTTSVPGAGSVRLNVRVAGPDDGIPVLLLHGQALSGRVWHKAMTGPLAQTARMIAPDYRAHGQLQKPRSGWFSPGGALGTGRARLTRSRSLKHVRRLEGLGANVLSLYAKGLRTGEIQAHLVEIYDTEVWRETISKITDQVLGEMVAWQSRPLDRVYPVLLTCAIRCEGQGQPGR